MHLPKDFQDDKSTLWTVGVLEECLCVTNYVSKPCQIEIWVMHDYGVQESWTKRFVIRQEEVTKNNLWQLRVIWSFKDAKILLKSDCERHFVLYDPKQDTVRSSSLVICGAENYVESLVSLNSGIYVGSRHGYANTLRAPLRVRGISRIIRNDTGGFVACYGKQHIL